MQLKIPSRFRVSLIVLLLLAILFSSCSLPAEVKHLPQSSSAGISPSPAIQTVATSFQPSSPSPLAPSKISTGAPSTSTPPSGGSLPDASPTQYTLDARLDFFRHSVSVEETILYTNTTGIDLTDLALGVEANRYPGAFQLDALTWANGSPAGSYSLENNRLLIQLPQPLKSLASLKLSLTYHLFLPEIPPPSDTTRPVPFGYTERQTNLVDWYPYIPPYRPGQGWLIHKPWFYGEHQVYDVGDYRVRLLVSAGDLKPVIAASALPQPEGKWLDYRLEKARSFAISVGLEYILSTQKMNGVTVLSYAFPFDKRAGEAALQETAKALDLYTKLYGPYPYDSLSVVEADFLDGMEYHGLYFLSRGFYNLYDGTHRGYLTAIAVHETAHQWWYGEVANDQALEPWLDEALCTYSEKIFYEQTYPDLVDWWWGFRVNFYQPEGWVDGQLYDFDGFRPYVNAVYLRGAIFLENLRKAVGDEAFFAFIKDYAAREKGKLSSKQDFFTILGEHSQVKIDQLLSQYFRPEESSR